MFFSVWKIMDFHCIYQLEIGIYCPFRV